MREIKFKAKRKNNNEWVYGNLVYIKWCNEYYIIDFNTNIYNENKFGDIKELDIVEVIPETLSQYTSLKDKNGVEIYENDKVKYDYEFLTEIGVVTYNQDNASYQIKGISSSSMKHHKKLIVIGNIYDKEVK